MPRFSGGGNNRGRHGCREASHVRDAAFGHRRFDSHFGLALRLQPIIFTGALFPWIEGKSDSDFIEVSGNIEAHESVVSFKTVQSRIAELPFDEEAQVSRLARCSRGSTTSRLRQQVVIDRAKPCNAQKRQLDVAEQNVDAARRTVISDEADVALKQLEYDRAQTLLESEAPALSTRVMWL